MSPLPRHLLRDEPLARLAAGGDRGAFEVLFGRYRSALLRCARSIVRNDHDAQDVVQTTALKAMAGLARRRPGVPFRPWLFRIAYNEAISVLRLRRTRPAQELELTVAHPEPGPAQQALDRAELRDLIDDLTHLTEGQRTALLLRQLNGASYDEIARVLETTPIAARRSVATARGNLAAFAQGRDAGCTAIQLTLAAGDRRAMRARTVRAHLRSCPACRAQAARASRGARAAAFIPVPVAELLAALRGLLAPASAGLSDGAGAPVSKALAVAAAVTAGVGAAGGALHRHDDHSAAAGPSARAQVTPAHVHTTHFTHAAHHAAPVVVPHAASRVVTAALPRAGRAPVSRTRAIPMHAAARTAGGHRVDAVYTPPAVFHHVVRPRHDAARGAPSPVGAPAPAPVAHHTAPAAHHTVPVADHTAPAAAPAPSAPATAQPTATPPFTPPFTPPSMPSSGSAVASSNCPPGSSGSAPAHTDFSQLGPHSGPPGAST